jgi:hypothetical protein
MTGRPDAAPPVTLPVRNSSTQLTMAPCQFLARIPICVAGQSAAALPRSSDLDFLGDIKRVVDLDAQIADRALNLRVAEEQLNCPEIPGAAANQGRLSTAHGVRGVLERIEADASDPFTDEASVLACRKMLVRATTAGNNIDQVFGR